MEPDRGGSQDARVSPCNLLSPPDRESPGKTKGRETYTQPKSKDRLQSPVKCFKPADVMLSVILKTGCCQGEQRLKVSFATTALISSVSCPILDALIVFCLSSFVVLPQVLGQPISTQHLLLYCRKLSLAGLQISTKRSGCVPLLLCRWIIYQCIENLYFFSWK